MKIKEKVEFTERIKTFFKLNWWLLWISYFALCFFVYYTSEEMKQQNEEVKSLLIKEVKGVVFLGANGQAVFGEKQRLDGNDENFKKAVKNILLHYLIHDSSSLTKSFNVKINEYMDIVRNSDELSEFYKNFIVKDKKNYPNAIPLFQSVLLGFARAIQEDTLPEQIVPTESSITSYLWNDKEQTFDIIINVKANTYIYNNINNNYDLKQGTLQIRAKGFFNLFVNNNINPLGVQFFEIGLTNASK